MARFWGLVFLVGGLCLAGTELVFGDPPAPVEQAGPQQEKPIEQAGPLEEKQGPSDQYGDPLPPGALARMGTVRFRHGASVYFTGFAADGKELITASSDGFVRVWETESGKELRRIALPMTFRGGGYSATSDGNVTIVHSYNGGGNVLMALSPKGDTLAILDNSNSGNSNSGQLWDVATGKKLAQFRIAANAAGSPVFSPDGKMLATRYDQRIHLWNARNGKEIRQVGKAPEGKNRVYYGQSGNTLAFSPDGKNLVSFEVARGDKNNELTSTINLHEVETGNEIRAFKGPQDVYGAALAYAPDGKHIVLASQDSKTRVYEAETGKELRQLEEKDQGSNGTILAFSPDGKVLAQRSPHGPTIRLFDFASGKLLRHLGAKPAANGGNQFWGYNNDNSQDVAFTPDGKLLAMGTEYGAVRLWEVDSGKERLPVQGHQGDVSTLLLSGDGKLLTTVAADGTLRQWDAATGKEQRKLNLPAGGGRPVFAPDGKTFVFGTPGNKLQLWDVALGKEIRTYPLTKINFEQLPGGGGGMAFAPDGKTLTVKDFDGMVRVFDVATAKETTKFSIKSGDKPTVVYMNNSTPNIALAADGVTVAMLGSAPNPNAEVNGFDFGESNGTRVIRLWNVSVGKQVRQFDVRKNDMLAIAFSPDGRTIASANQDQTISLWEALTGKERCQFKVKGGGFAAGVKILLGRNNMNDTLALTCLAFSPDGRTLAAGGEDHKLYVWDVRSGKKLGEFAGHQGTVRSVAFTPDGQRIISGSADTTALVFDAAPLMKQEAPALVEVEADKLDSLWSDLADDHSPRAYQAIEVLIKAQKQTLPLLKERVKPAVGVAPKRLEELLADLESNQFVVRQKASDELEKLGELVEPDLKKILQGQPTLEVRQRVEKLLERLVTGQAPPADLLRSLRVLEVLELIGTPEAREALDGLAKGVAGARLTRDAKASLERLTKHQTRE